jgi:hypothetical protein
VDRVLADAKKNAGDRKVAACHYGSNQQIELRCRLVIVHVVSAIPKHLHACQGALKLTGFGTVQRIKQAIAAARRCSTLQSG